MKYVRLQLWLIATAALCQDRPECATAALRLHSVIPSEHAWAARLATDNHCAALAPEIARMLLKAADATPVAYAYLEALIELRPTLDEPSLISLAKEFPDEAAILILQDASSHQKSLAFLQTSRSGTAWLAASNALASMHARGFAASLLREPAIRHRFVIGGTEACCTSVFKMLSGQPRSLRVPASFPAVNLYRLVTKPSGLDKQVSDGPTPVYVRRVLFGPGVERATDDPSQPPLFNLELERDRYLAQLAGLSLSEIERALEPNSAMPWSDHLEADIKRDLEDQASLIDRVTEALMKAGVLTPIELLKPLRIETQIENRSGLTVPEIGPYQIPIHP